MRFSKTNLNTFFFCIAVFAASTRGLTEYLINKSAASIIQVFVIIVSLLFAFDLTSLRYFLGKTKTGMSILVVLILCLLSIYVTNSYNGVFGFNYVILVVFTFYLIFSVYAIESKDQVNGTVAYNFVVGNCFILTLFAISQQLRTEIVVFPGQTADFGLVRPQSITGSYLHYPILLGIITSATFVRFFQDIKVKSFLIFFYFFICLITTLSRSGMLILFTVIVYSVLRNISIKNIFILILGLGVIVALSLIFNDVSDVIISRLGGSANLESAGNDSRLFIWNRAADMMSGVNIFVGSYFGLVTNSAPDEIKVGVVESSLLQQILNLGLIASILYYMILFRIKNIIPVEYRIILIACLAQSLIYQSIEVIPYLFFMITLPIYTRKKDENIIYLSVSSST
jgi:hypothetical protein